MTAGNDQKSADILYSPGKNDECMTPDYAVKPLLDIITLPFGSNVWCPFSKPDSQFVIVLSEKYNVFHSHIHDGQDFYNFDPYDQLVPFRWDAIIDNPPFWRKKQIFQRAMDLCPPNSGKKFMLLMTYLWGNDPTPYQLFHDNNQPMHRIEPWQRTYFKCNEEIKRDITFKSIYYGNGMLPSNADTVTVDLRPYGWARPKK